jgi:alkylation response protein AidB-like acyl-CoA dehydrogenase
MLRPVYEDDHEAFRSSVHEFLDRKVWPRVDELAQGKGIPRAIWRGAGTQGYLGLEIPEQYGGSAARD